MRRERREEQQPGNSGELVVSGSYRAEVLEPAKAALDDVSAFLADRVVVMTRRPGRIKEIVDGKSAREQDDGNRFTPIDVMDLDIRKITLQQIAFIGSYCYTTMDFRHTVAGLAARQFGDLRWFEQRPLSQGAAAFAAIDQGSIPAAKIILRP